LDQRTADLSTPSSCGHHIFTQPLLRFLIPYIALIETKLALNPTEDIERKQRALSK
jgi:hypothetical protein